MKYLVLGVGVQGRLYAARLAAAGGDVTLVARGRRAQDLRPHLMRLCAAIEGYGPEMPRSLRRPVEAVIV